VKIIGLYLNIVTTPLIFSYGNKTLNIGFLRINSLIAF